MVPFPARRADAPETPPEAPFRSRISPEIEELSSRLAEQGIESTDLVLDLVLHDLADEARQALDASGAAIALERDGELVCRAAAGSTAPDLGVRIHTESGLSGICVKQGSAQVCNDTEADGRVDGEACRRLGVRSIAVVPLGSGIAGIFEAFSDRAGAFSAEHLTRLESLAVAAAQSIKSARNKAAHPSEPKSAMVGEASVNGAADISVASIMQKVSPVDPAVRVLRWLVIGLAVPLVVLIGFDWGWHRAHRPLRNPVISNSAPAQTEPQPENPAPGTGQNALLPSPQKISPARPKPSDDLASRGGLVIYQNGKVIYREGPAAAQKQPALPPPQSSPNLAVPAVPETKADTPAKATSNLEPPVDTAISLPSGVSGGRLLHSVHPRYPAEAVTQKIEGPVVLHGTVGEDGVIRDLKLVSGNPMLSTAALEAVQQWRYEPYRRNGAPIAMPIDITIDFKLPK